MRNIKGLALVLTLGAGLMASAQTPTSPHLLSPSTPGYMARGELFDVKKIPSATADQLQRLLTSGAALDEEQRIELLYLLGTAYAATDDARCVSLLDEFTRLYPSSLLATQATLSNADFLFFAGKYSEALEEYNKIDVDQLPDNLHAGALYRRAYCMIKCGFYNEARPLITSILHDSEYGKGAIFYDAWLDYQEGNLTQAYQKFSRIDPQPASSGKYNRTQRRLNYEPTGLEAGYYMAQIEYLQGKYGEALRRAETLMKKTPVAQLLPETERVAGMCSYHLHKYPEAISYLSNYVDDAGEEAYYESIYALAVMLYDEGGMANMEKAASLFSRLTDYRDSIGQSAWLYLGQIEAAQGDDNTALMAFEKASRMSFDRDVTRAALYNYVTARTRGGNIPFNTSVDLLEEFLSQYPDSEQAPAVREYLATSYFNNKDYASALLNIDKIKNPSQSVQRAKQKILYELGITQLSDGKTTEAITSFSRAVALGNINKDMKAKASLWLGDAYFEAGEWKNAADAYTQALSGKLGDNTSLAQYGKAYSLTRLGQYKEALPFFNAAAESKTLPSPLRADARLRAADCKLYSGQTAAAQADYKKLAAGEGADAEYAAWRDARIMGLNGDTEAMIKSLSSLATTASGKYLPDILADLSSALLSEGRRVEAAPYMRRLVQGWPNSDTARAADADLRLTYASTGQLTEYADFLKSIGSPFAISDSDLESLSFQAAAADFNATPSNSAKIEQYVKDFPTGANIAEAWSMVARALEEKGERSEALQAYKALLNLGRKDYSSFVAQGIMNNSDDADEIITYSRQLQATGGLDADLNAEARYREAEALSKKGDTKGAMAIWTELAPNTSSEWGARSAVMLGETLLKDGEAAKAEKVLTDFVDAGAQSPYWLARGYIALADALVAQKKNYMARQYLESLRDNYPGKEKDITSMINTRLQKLKKK